MTRARRLLPFAALALVCLTSSCATNHLIEWSADRASFYGKPTEQKSIFVRSAGTVVAFPLAIVWDVVTFPFQWVWDAYPYGEQLVPSDYQSKN